MQKMVSRVPHHKILKNNNKNDQISILGSNHLFTHFWLWSGGSFGERTFYNF